MLMLAMVLSMFVFVPCRVSVVFLSVSTFVLIWTLWVFLISMMVFPFFPMMWAPSPLGIIIIWVTLVSLILLVVGGEDWVVEMGDGCSEEVVALISLGDMGCSGFCDRCWVISSAMRSATSLPPSAVRW